MNFVYRKSTGNFKLLKKDRETILKELREGGKDLSDYLVLPPEEFRSFLNESQSREIANARLKQIKEDNPQLSQYFPSTAKEIAESGKKPFATRAGSDDALSLGGRSLGAIADGVLNKGDFGTNYMESLGQAKAEEQDRGFLGGFAQGTLRDPLLLPGLAIPVGKIPYIKNIGANAATNFSKFMQGSLLKPMAEGAAGGAIVETTRPLATSEEFSPLRMAEGILGGAVLNTGFSNLGGAFKYGAAKARNKYSSNQAASEQKNVIIENSRQRQGRSADEITDIDIANARELAEKLEKKGLTLEDAIRMEPQNSAPAEKSKNLDFWDSKAAETDLRNYANTFENMPLYKIRDDLAARAKVNPKALEATLSPESMALMSKLHSEGRLGVGRRHLNDIHNSEFKPHLILVLAFVFFALLMAQAPPSWLPASSSSRADTVVKVRTVVKTRVDTLVVRDTVLRVDTVSRPSPASSGIYRYRVRICDAQKDTVTSLPSWDADVSAGGVKNALGSLFSDQFSKNCYALENTAGRFSFEHGKDEYVNIGSIIDANGIIRSTTEKVLTGVKLDISGDTVMIDYLNVKRIKFSSLFDNGYADFYTTYSNDYLSCRLWLFCSSKREDYYFSLLSGKFF